MAKPLVNSGFFYSALPIRLAAFSPAIYARPAKRRASDDRPAMLTG